MLSLFFIVHPFKKTLIFFQIRRIKVILNPPISMSSYPHVGKCFCCTCAQWLAVFAVGVFAGREGLRLIFALDKYNHSLKYACTDKGHVILK